MKSIVLGIAMLLSSVSVASAARLSGQEVAALLGAGPVTMVAGSVLTAQAGGRAEFRHSNSSEVGPLELSSNGSVTLLDEATGRTVKFYFDRDRNGVLTLVHTAGRFRGEQYRVAE